MDNRTSDGSTTQDSRSFTNSSEHPTSTIPLTLKLTPELEKDLRERYEITSYEFQDNGSEYNDPNEYERPGGDQGLVIIFNQENFDTDLPTRYGSSRDVDNVRETFSKLGFNVKTQNLHCDEGRQQILEIFSMYGEDYDTNRANALIVVFMSHGDRENILYTRDGQITVMDLIEPFSSYKFKNKPKLFIIQACKSTEEDMLQNQKPQLIFPIYNLPVDSIIYYSTIEGNVSIRDPNDGTWVISELCKNFLMYGRREDVVSLLQRTTKCISIFETELTNKMPYKQMPVIVSTLQKKFYLSSNKYRENLYAATKAVRDVSNELNNLLQQCGLK